jgi:EAL domain-containing protein (putative c-di-GMP-specific phosphodiesterase class I)
LRVVAEGVENEMQIEQLKKLDCEGAQGYFFAEPMAFEKVRSFLNKNGIADLPEGRFEDAPVLATIQ